MKDSGYFEYDRDGKRREIAAALPPDIFFDDAPAHESPPERGDRAEMTLRLAQHFDGLPEKQQAAHVRAFLRVNLFDRRTLRKSAALAGCSRSTLLRAETILKRILQR